MLRLALAPVFLLVETDAARAAVLVVASLSEWADGWVARRYGWGSRFGELFDPIVDRIFVVTAFVTFVLLGRLGALELVILLLRDVFTALAAAAALVFRVPVRVKARMAGKVVTTLQLAALLVLLFLPGWIGPMVLVVGVAGAVAIADYARVGVHALRRR